MAMLSSKLSHPVTRSVRRAYRSFLTDKIKCVTCCYAVVMLLCMLVKAALQCYCLLRLLPTSGKHRVSAALGMRYILEVIEVLLLF